jgi:hypothetical protein
MPSIFNRRTEDGDGVKVVSSLHSIFDFVTIDQADNWQICIPDGATFFCGQETGIFEVLSWKFPTLNNVSVI